MDDCLFCNIASKKMPAEVVYEDDHALAFLDIHPKAVGHTMVVPRIHSERLFDLPEGEIGPLFGAVKRMAGRIAKAFGADGLTIGINEGRAGGQAVDHLHVHILPRFEGDGGGSLHSVVNNPPKESLSEVADTLRKTAS